VCLLDDNPVIPPRFCTGAELSDVVRKKYGVIDYEYGISGASTDFVSVLVYISGRLTNFTLGKCFILYVLVVKSGTDFDIHYPPVMPGLHPGFCSYSSPFCR
jgi:hypothetical protein